jgi:hypothetical protein
MPSLPCPSCGRALNFPEALRGALVQCPACRHSFTAPEEEPPAPARPPAVPLARPVPPTAPGPFEFGSSEDAQVDRHRAALRSAAWWLRSAVMVGFATGLLSCCTLPVLTFQPDAAALFVLAGTVPFEYLPLILVAAGLTHLKERRSYRLCLASAVSVLPPSLWALLHTWALGRAALDELAGGEPAGFFFLALAAVTLFGAAAGVIGAVKALALLSDGEVRRSFH